MVSQMFPYTNQQPVLTQNNPMGGYGQGNSSAAPSQQSRFTTPMPGTFRSLGLPVFPPEQYYSQNLQQGSFHGFDPNDRPVQASYEGQSNIGMSNQSSEPPMGSLPQVHRPIFDRHGYVVGEQGNMNAGNMYGGNMCDSNPYSSNMYSNMHSSNMYSNMHGNTMVVPPQPMPSQGSQQQFNPTQPVQNAETSNLQLAADAQSFFSFVKHKMGQDEDYQDEGGQESNQAEVDQDERDQDEGIALGNTSSNNAISINSQRAASRPPLPVIKPVPVYRPESSPTFLLLASEKEPHRFADNTGMNLCDYCGRDGHEADACIKWDPVHFDKPVCTACNNDQHSLDECPKFRAMPLPERQALLLGKGGRRPGVRSEHHAWTRYVHRGGNYNKEGAGGGLPLTRLFLRNISLDKDSGAMLQNAWKVWDYGRGVPERFWDPRAESLAGDPVVDVDERFKGGQHKLGWRMPVPQSVSRPAPNQGVTPLYKPVSQFRNKDEEEGDETEL